MAKFKHVDEDIKLQGLSYTWGWDYKLLCDWKTLWHLKDEYMQPFDQFYAYTHRNECTCAPHDSFGLQAALAAQSKKQSYVD